jgi:glycerol-3-phosphate dehydrogenase
LNATGVWAGELVDSVRLRPSRGSHLVLDGARLGLTGTALTVPIPGSLNRFVLLLPQQDGRCYLGLTDEPLDGPIPDVPTVPESDVDFLLETASSALARPLTRADVIGRFAGLRPLVASGSRKTADLSRRHAVVTGPNGVVTVVGGKLTTYRRMAQDAVDALGLNTRPSSTSHIRLVEHSIVDSEPLLPGGTVTREDVLRAVRDEGALTAEDVLDRRTRLGLVDADRDAALSEVSALVAKCLAEFGGC